MEQAKNTYFCMWNTERDGRACIAWQKIKAFSAEHAKKLLCIRRRAKDLEAFEALEVVTLPDDMFDDLPEID